MGVCWTVRQSTVVMSMTASGLAALGLSHIRHSVKLLFAKAMRGEEGLGGLGHGSRGKGLAGGVHGHFKLAHTPFTSVSQRCWQRGTAKVRVARRERGDKGKEVQEPPPSPLPSLARVTLKLKLKLSIVFCRLHWTRGRSLGMQGGAGREEDRQGEKRGQRRAGMKSTLCKCVWVGVQVNSFCFVSFNSKTGASQRERRRNLKKLN